MRQEIKRRDRQDRYACGSMDDPGRIGRTTDRMVASLSAWDKRAMSARPQFGVLRAARVREPGSAADRVVGEVHAAMGGLARVLSDPCQPHKPQPERDAIPGLAKALPASTRAHRVRQAPTGN